jgi:rhamnogalacturonyl hydrolase YesR
MREAKMTVTTNKTQPSSRTPAGSYAIPSKHRDLTPLQYARAACDTMMRKFKAEELPAVGLFNYTQGVFLSGVWKTAQLTGDDKYFRYVKDWVDSVITDDGEIIDYYHGDFDSMQPGISVIWFTR